MTSTASQSVSQWSRGIIDALVQGGSISYDDGARALERAGITGAPVSAVLLDEGLVSSVTALECLSAISGLRSVDLRQAPPEPAARAAIGEAIARVHGVVGYRLDGKRIALACVEPLNAEQLRDVATTSGLEITECVLGDVGEIRRLIIEQIANASVAAVDTSASEATPEPAASEEAESVEPPAQGTAATPASLNDLLVYATRNGASDLHLSYGFAPAVRIDGAIRRIEGFAPLDDDQIRELVFSILPQIARERFEATKELDTSHSVHGVGRFRVSVFQQRGHVGAVLRAIPSNIPDLAGLGLPPVLGNFADLRRGLVLVTGPTGSGKSTTLAAIVSLINQTKPLHIMTIEDPIEFVHESAQSIVNQREVGIDTTSFAESLRHVLRQDPDVILVGEMRDLETISTALTAAETGHLVFATLHTQDAPQTLDRIIDVFPTAQQEQVRVQLASALQAVVTQQLVLSAQGSGRVPVAEVMLCTPAIRNLIRTGKTHQLYSLMQTGGSFGMQTMDQGLARAVKEGRISRDMAFDRCHDANELTDYLRA